MSKSIAIVVARFNEPVTSKLEQGAVSELKRLGFLDEQLAIYHVPGAVEIPLVAKRLAQTKKYSAIIALGAVIRGETDHYDYVCQQVSDGCQRIALEQDLPVLFGVLTTQRAELAFARADSKGQETAMAAVEMIQLLDNIAISVGV